MSGAKILWMFSLMAVLAGCSPARDPFVKERREAMGKANVEACKLKGGHMEPVCLMGIPACVAAFQDAGRPCTDSSQCSGGCILDPWATEQPKPGDAASGICRQNNNPCGCYTSTVNGRADAGVCYD
jgi:hypothetical protein